VRTETDPLQTENVPFIFYVKKTQTEGISLGDSNRMPWIKSGPAGAVEKARSGSILFFIHFTSIWSNHTLPVEWTPSPLPA
jgi:hypothetical protein